MKPSSWASHLDHLPLSASPKEKRRLVKESLNARELICLITGEDLVNESTNWENVTRDDVDDRISDLPVMSRHVHEPAPLAPRVDRQPSDIDQLKSELARIHTEQGREFRELRLRIDNLEQKLDSLLAAHMADEDEIPPDPHTRWIERNSEILAGYPNSWVALDAERGIVLHAVDGDEFANKLSALTQEEREKLLTFHTSMYL